MEFVEGEKVFCYHGIFIYEAKVSLLSLFRSSKSTRLNTLFTTKDGSLNGMNGFLLNASSNSAMKTKPFKRTFEQRALITKKQKRNSKETQRKEKRMTRPMEKSPPLFSLLYPTL